MDFLFPPVCLGFSIVPIIEFAGGDAYFTAEREMAAMLISLRRSSEFVGSAALLVAGYCFFILFSRVAFVVVGFDSLGFLEVGGLWTSGCVEVLPEMVIWELFG